MTDDERYIEVDGRRWRRSDPAIPDALKSELVSELMSARRAVKSAKDDADNDALIAARARVNDAKLALGERGAPWWERVEEAERRNRIAAAIRTLLRRRDRGKTICPSDAARVAGGKDWRELMEPARSVARELADDGWLEIVQKGERVDDPGRGPIRLRRRA